jgi:hypothetical protein
VGGGTASGKKKKKKKKKKEEEEEREKKKKKPPACCRPQPPRRAPPPPPWTARGCPPPQRPTLSGCLRRPRRAGHAPAGRRAGPRLPQNPHRGSPTLHPAPAARAPAPSSSSSSEPPRRPDSPSRPCTEELPWTYPGPTLDHPFPGRFAKGEMDIAPAAYPVPTLHLPCTAAACAPCRPTTPRPLSPEGGEGIRASHQVPTLHHPAAVRDRERPSHSHKRTPPRADSAKRQATQTSPTGTGTPTLHLALLGAQKPAPGRPRLFCS